MTTVIYLKHYCPACGRETDCSILSHKEYDGYNTLKLYCFECYGEFERIYPPPGYYWLICDGCAALTQIKLVNPEDKAIVTVTCKCGKVSTYDTAEMTPTGGKRE